MCVVFPPPINKAYCKSISRRHIMPQRIHLRESVVLWDRIENHMAYFPILHTRHLTNGHPLPCSKEHTIEKSMSHYKQVLSEASVLPQEKQFTRSKIHMFHCFHVIGHFKITRQWQLPAGNASPIALLQQRIDNHGEFQPLVNHKSRVGSSLKRTYPKFIKLHRHLPKFSCQHLGLLAAFSRKMSGKLTLKNLRHVLFRFTMAR